MSLELGFILTGAVVVLASVSMAGFLIWLRKREKKVDEHSHNNIKPA
jgi:hypothetical protein